MLLTIDGHAAAGKTTQSHRLTDALKAKMRDKRLGLYFRELGDLRKKLMSDPDVRDKSDLYFLFDLVKSKYAAHHTNYNLTEELTIVDEFWLILWERGVSDRYLNIFKEFMPIPDISFYIDISAEESFIRSQKRTFKEKGLEKDVLPEAIAERKDQFVKMDEHANKFWTWIKSKVPTIYTIDGRQPEDDVTLEIIDITRQNL